MTAAEVGRAGPRQAILDKIPRMYRVDGSNVRTLLVDDERALTNLIRMALRYEGWDIDVAHDAATARAASSPALGRRSRCPPPNSNCSVT
jgi:two-component system response regulator TrcR